MHVCRLSVLTAPVLLLIASAPTQAADFPTGTFTTTSSEGAVWNVTFWEKGRFTATRDGRDAVSGRYAVEKDVIEITDEAGPSAGKGLEKTGSYRWKLNGKKLTLTLIKDKNAGREALLTGTAFEQKD